MTGDPPRAGDYVNATAVFDVDAIGLVRILAGMNRGVDAAGNSIGEPTAFGIGVAVDPGAADPAREIDRLQAKVEAGADVGPDAAGLRPRQLDASSRRLGRLPVPLVVGILPLHSFRHAEFLHNEVPGITVPDAVRARLGRPGPRAPGRRRDRPGHAREVRRRHAGAYLMPSFGRFEVVAEVLEALR